MLGNSRQELLVDILDHILTTEGWSCRSIRGTGPSLQQIDWTSTAVLRWNPLGIMKEFIFRFMVALCDQSWVAAGNHCPQRKKGRWLVLLLFLDYVPSFFLFVQMNNKFFIRPHRKRNKVSRSLSYIWFGPALADFHCLPMQWWPLTFLSFLQLLPPPASLG